MESLVRILRLALSRPALLAVALGSLLLLAGECKRHAEAREIAARPRIAVNVPRFDRYKPDAVDASLRTWRPPARDARKLERAFGVTVKSTESDEGADLLAHKEVSVDCGDGGTRTLEIVATLPEGSGPREVEIRTRQDAGDFWSLRGAFGLGGLWGKGSDGERFRAYGFAEPVKVGRFRLRGEAGVEGRAGETSWYAMAGAEIRF